ncbi:MAG TPA: hypothetical protein VK668_20460 [Mucilaginibacter sp.]|nr:hypothetical protein [Mucilaginibacter sp.]
MKNILLYLSVIACLSFNACSKKTEVKPQTHTIKLTITTTTSDLTVSSFIHKKGVTGNTSLDIDKNVTSTYVLTYDLAAGDAVIFYATPDQDCTIDYAFTRDGNPDFSAEHVPLNAGVLAAMEYDIK